MQNENIKTDAQFVSTDLIYVLVKLKNFATVRFEVT